MVEPNNFERETGRWGEGGRDYVVRDVFVKALVFSLFLQCSVQFSRSVVSNSLRPHESQHARPPCPSPAPRVHSKSCPLSQWCHPTISSSVVRFSCPQSLPASGSFPVSQLLAWGGQSIGVSASASVLPMNTQDWSPLGWTDWISLQSKGLSRVFSNTTVQKHQFFSTQLSSQSNSHIKHNWIGIYLVVQWLRHSVLPLQGVWVQSLVGELRSHMQCVVAKKKKKIN